MTGRGAWIRGASGEWAALSCGDTDEAGRANARRIVACINACQGIPHPEHLQELIDACALAEFDRGAEQPIRAALAKMFDRAG